MDCKPTFWRALDVEGEFQFSVVGWNLEAGELRGQSGGDVCLDLLLKFLARKPPRAAGRWDRWRGR